MKVDLLKTEGTKACLAKTAIYKFTKAIQIDPDSHILYSKRSAVFSAQTEYQRALFDAEKAIELRPRCVKGWIFKGAALHGLRDLVASQNAYEEALKLEPGNYNARFGLESVQRVVGVEPMSDTAGLVDGQGGLFLADSQVGQAPVVKCEDDVEQKLEALKADNVGAVEVLADSQKKEDANAIQGANCIQASVMQESSAMSEHNAIPDQVLISLMSTFAPEYLYGHEGPLPIGLATLLEEWHLAHRSRIPPCAYRPSWPPKQQWRVFGRDGEEVKHTVFQIYSRASRQYKILVLHNLAGQDRLVACIRQSRSRTFLWTWNGSENDFESETSVVRLFGKSTTEIRFQKDVFDDALKKPIAGVITTKRASLSVLMAQPQMSNTSVRHRRLPTRSDGHILNNSPLEEASSSDDNYTAVSFGSEEPCARPSRPKKKKKKRRRQGCEYTIHLD